MKAPRVAIFCSCGAAWYGWSAVDNAVIDDHRRRCGPMISVEQFMRMGHRTKWPTTWTIDDRRKAVQPGR
jgi:hypothetical protein